MEAARLLANGERLVARRLLTAWVQAHPTDGAAWALLGEAVDDPAQRADCLRRAERFGGATPAVPVSVTPPPAIPVPALLSAPPVVPPRPSPTATPTRSRRIPIVLLCIGVALIGGIGGWLLQHRTVSAPVTTAMPTSTLPAPMSTLPAPTSTLRAPTPTVPVVPTAASAAAANPNSQIAYVQARGAEYDLYLMDLGTRRTTRTHVPPWPRNLAGLVARWSRVGVCGDRR